MGLQGSTIQMDTDDMMQFWRDACRRAMHRNERNTVLRFLESSYRLINSADHISTTRWRDFLLEYYVVTLKRGVAEGEESVCMYLSASM